MNTVGDSLTAALADRRRQGADASPPMAHID